MKTIFLDIETVPTDPSLQENGLLEAQIQLNEAEVAHAGRGIHQRFERSFPRAG